MKNIQRPGWIRHTDEISTTYTFDLDTDTQAIVTFYDSDMSFIAEVSGDDSHETDIRTKYEGSFDNTAEDIQFILTQSETLRLREQAAKGLYTRPSLAA